MLDRPAKSTRAAPVDPASQRPDLRAGSSRETAAGQESVVRREGEAGHESLAERESLSGFLSAVRQRRATLLSVIVLVPLCTWVVLQHMTPLFTATGSLIYEPSGFKVQELQSILREDPTNEATMASQAEILRSLHIAQIVAERGNLFDDPEFNVSLRPPGMLHWLTLTVRWLLGMEVDAPAPEPVYGPQQDRTRDHTLVAVQEALHATAVHQSHVVEVSFTAADPVVAAAAVNNAMDGYIKGQYAAKHRAVDAANALLEKQAGELRRQVRQVEERMSAYRAEHGLSQGIHAATETEEISRLTEDLVTAEADRAAATARLDAARGRAGAEAQAAVAPSVAALRAQQEQLAGQIKGQQARLGSAHPESRGLNQQYADGQRALNAEIARVVAATEAEQHAASDRVASLQAMLAKTKTAAEGSARAEIPLNAMSRDLEAARGQLQAVLDRIQQTAQQAAVENSEAHEISEAIPPDRPAYPHKPQIMAASIAAAVFLGLLLIYVLQLTDGTLHSGKELRLVTGLPCLALIPQVGRRALGHLKIEDYVIRRPLTTFAEQVRALRAALSLDIDQPQIITVTGAEPGDGKSVLTLALARSAALDGERVLTIECDVRRGTFEQRLRGCAMSDEEESGAAMPPVKVPGLLDVLRKQAEWRDAVQVDSISDMDFVVAGKPGSDVLGLFLSEDMRQLLRDARDKYDLILLDAPPVEAMTEARVAAALSDATLLCVRWRRTSVKTLMHTLEALRDAHATVIGTVLTRVDPRVHLRSGSADAAVYHRRYKAYFRG